MEKMRAAIIVEKGKMECTTAPVRSPEEGQVLMRNQFASICGSDLHIVHMGMALAEQWLVGAQIQKIQRNYALG